MSMTAERYQNYTEILHHELITAMGCTEPIAIAYAGALARRILNAVPDRVEVACSGNIVKNVKAVVVPNSGGQRGIEIAALLGITGGNPDAALSVLESVTEADRETATELLHKGICTASLIEGEEGLHIVLTATAGSDTAKVEILGTHTNVACLERNGVVLQADNLEDVSLVSAGPDKSGLNVRDILEYGATVDLSTVEECLERQIRCNTAISAEGLDDAWGAQVGKTLRQMYGSAFPEVRASAAAAAGSDARMNGCPMPVVINSGSGNQGLTISMPIVIYAEHLGVSREKELRALAIGNLLSVHQKRYIGSLSAYCGATSAAAAAAAAICWMMGGDYEQVCGVITNTLGTIGGMICDGAKSSCASKIATAVYSALLGVRMSMEGRCFEPGEGIVTKDVETTIADMGQIARDGMRSTDVEVLQLMLANH